MHLKFIGYYAELAALRYQRNTTAAFLREHNKILLIDCGSTTAETICKETSRFFDGVQEIFILITHMHPDHTEGLGKLIDFCKYYKKIKVSIVKSPLMGQINALLRIWNIFNDTDILPDGITPSYTFCNTEVLPFKNFQTVSFIPTTHVSGLDCYSLKFETKDGPILYTGDTQDIEQIEDFVNENFYCLYTEVWLNDFAGNIHLSLRALANVIPKEKRHKVIMMHFDDVKCIREAEKLGFLTANYYSIEA